MNRKVKLGIIGIGNTRAIANDHIQSFLKIDNVKIEAIYTRTIEKAYKYLNEVNLNAKVCVSYDDLLKLVDAVIICTIDNSHIELSRKALENGKHVLCEKPFGTSYHEALNTANYAQNLGLVNMVGYNFRYQPGPQFMKKVIDNGEIGEIFTYKHNMGANRLAKINLPYEWRMDKTQCKAGTIVDFGSHMVDFIYYLLTDNTGKIKKVTSHKSILVKSRPIQNTDLLKEVTTDDCSTTIFKMENDAMAVISNSRLGTMYDSFEISGSKGMLYYSSNDSEDIYLWKKDKNGDYSGGPEKISIINDTKSSYEVQGRLFINAITRNEKYDQNFTHASNIQHILDCMIASAEEGKTILV